MFGNHCAGPPFYHGSDSASSRYSKTKQSQEDYPRQWSEDPCLLCYTCEGDPSQLGFGSRYNPSLNTSPLQVLTPFWAMSLLGLTSHQGLLGSCRVRRLQVNRGVPKSDNHKTKIEEQKKTTRYQPWFGICFRKKTMPQSCPSWGRRWSG
jgi:hypothetical protein